MCEIHVQINHKKTLRQEHIHPGKHVSNQSRHSHEAPIIKQTKLTTHLSNLNDELNQRVHNVEKLGLHHMATGPRQNVFLSISRIENMGKFTKE